MAEANLTRFRLLVAAAAVDGRVAESEDAVLRSLGDELGLEAQAVRAAIQGAGGQQSLALGELGGPAERLELLRQLAAVVRADGRIAAEERVLFERVAGALQVAAAEWQPLLEALGAGASASESDAPAPSSNAPVPASDAPDSAAIGAPVPASDAPDSAAIGAPDPATDSTPGLGARALAGLPPISVLLVAVAALLLVAGLLSFADPELLPSQRRILALLGAVLLAGGALRETGRTRAGLWLLVGLTTVTWLARHALGADAFGALCLALGVSAVPVALFLGRWVPDRTQVRAGLSAIRLVFGLGFLVALAGGMAASFEFFDLMSYGSEIDIPDRGTPGPGYGNLFEQVGGVLQLIGWLLIELVLAVVALGSFAAATALLFWTGGASLALVALEPDRAAPDTEQQPGDREVGP